MSASPSTKAKSKASTISITDYAPELKGTGYDGVTIKNALQMSSGVGWNEDYSDQNSDIARFGRTLAFGGSMVEFAKT